MHPNGNKYKQEEVLGILSRRPATGVLSRPSGPSVPGSVPESVPANGGVRRPSGPGLQSAQKASPRVSPDCQKGVLDTLGTLFGHFLEPRARGLKGPGTFRGTLRRTPPFSGTLGPKGPRDSCSWSAGSQSSGSWLKLNLHLDYESEWERRSL